MYTSIKLKGPTFSAVNSMGTGSTPLAPNSKSNIPSFIPPPRRGELALRAGDLMGFIVPQISQAIMDTVALMKVQAGHDHSVTLGSVLGVGTELLATSFSTDTSLIGVEVLDVATVAGVAPINL